MLHPTHKDFNINCLYITSELEDFLETMHGEVTPPHNPVQLQYSPHLDDTLDSTAYLITDSFVQLCWPFAREILFLLKKANTKPPTATATTHTATRPIKKVIPIQTTR